MTEDSKASFTWLFDTWLTVMNGRSPVSLVTGYDVAVAAAAARLFPNVRYRFCKPDIFNKSKYKLLDVYAIHPLLFKSEFKKYVDECDHTVEFKVTARGQSSEAMASKKCSYSRLSLEPLISTPKLPTLENWLSSSNMILVSLLSVKHKFLDENDNTRLCFQQITTEAQDEMVSRPGNDTVESAVSCLESSKALNMRFSISWCQRALLTAKVVYLISWCQRALLTAKVVYLKELLACYLTALYKAQLEKALHAFLAKVKVPMMLLFAKKIEDECIFIWVFGRQLCDAVSLTGKPCMHQSNSVMAGNSLPGTVVMPHTSGYVFRHACACGRSRSICEDPFDFDSVNAAFRSLCNCEDLLPTFMLSWGSNTGSLPPS